MNWQIMHQRDDNSEFCLLQNKTGTSHNITCQIDILLTYLPHKSQLSSATEVGPKAWQIADQKSFIQ